jgi:hypothetical protein
VTDTPAPTEPAWLKREKQHVLYWPDTPRPFVTRYEVGHVERWTRKRNLWIARHDYTPTSKLCDTLDEAKAWVVVMHRLTRN